ncbi:LPxTG-domain-containing protein [Colletotrichum tofieldiae]|uniref:LPxTG-domain-containing protein n=1 Tax=Colletotrichum tofieldiae TaxID=708197 RepID=A0A166MZD1_9PEZI|nr:LPxTG-domain-containing protein [Colletotrichum tofieldiae]
MPTPTISGTTIINLGPLTAWTAPESCDTITPSPALALSRVKGVPYFSMTCNIDGPVLNDCFPSASAFNSINHARKDTQERFNYQIYYSPAYECPSGWDTVGYGVRDETSSHSLSGIFADPTITVTAHEIRRTGAVSTIVSTISQVMPIFEPHHNLFMSAMEPSETVIMCCPTGYSVAAQGHCYSSIPRESYTATTGCQLRYANEDVELEMVDKTFTYHGRLVTGSDWARPEITSLYLATAAAVGLPDDSAAVASWQDLVAVNTGLDGTGIKVIGQRKSASGKKGENGDGKELHFGIFVVRVEGIWSLVVCVLL